MLRNCEETAAEPMLPLKFLNIFRWIGHFESFETNLFFSQKNYLNICTWYLLFWLNRKIFEVLSVQCKNKEIKKFKLVSNYSKILIRREINFTAMLFTYILAFRKIICLLKIIPFKRLSIIRSFEESFQGRKEHRIRTFHLSFSVLI